MVSVCLPSDALLQHLPSYLGFFYCGHGVSLHGCSSKAQPLLLTLDKGYLLTTALPEFQCGIAPLGPPVPMQPPLLGCGVAPPGRRPWPRTRGNSSQPFLHCHSLALWATASDLGHGAAPLCHTSVRSIGAGALLPSGPFSFQSQRKAMPKNAQTTAQLHSSYILVK